MVGRNAAQLRADAIATGLFDGPQRSYVGDGYSVPWEVAIAADLPSGFTMLGFKAYLDTYHKEYSRLHDWLYTPYGALINATQVEADDALQEELSAVDPVSGVIVGNACRYFGALYFGKSQVGYFGEGSYSSANNMALVDPIILEEGRVTGMPTKVVMLFQQTSIPPGSWPSLNYTPPARTAGWSEMLFGPDDIAVLIQQLKGPRQSNIPPLLQARAYLLNSNATIIGVRLYKGGAGKGQVLNLQYKGTSGPADQPGASLHFSATSTATGQSRRWLCRGIADGYIEGGEFKSDPAMTTTLQGYFAALSGFGWKTRLPTNVVKIFNIKADGTVTTDGVVPFALTNLVTFRQVLQESTGKRVGGRFKVIAVPDQSTFKVDEWPFGKCKGGNVCIMTEGYEDFGGAVKTPVRASFRKVGRPFAGYRGRKSRKKQTA